MTTLNINLQLQDADHGQLHSLNDVIASLGDAIQCVTVEIGTSEETFAISSEITGGNGPSWCLIWNKADANFLEIGFATTVYPLKLKFGEFQLVRLSDTVVSNLYLKSDTAASQVLIAVWEGEA